MDTVSTIDDVCVGVSLPRPFSGLFFGLGLFLAAMNAFGSSAIGAENIRRVALIVGNSSYTEFGELPNPRNDAGAMARLFREAKFDVVDANTDLTVQQFRRVLRDFAFKSAEADIAVVFYAGHGIEVAGTNYLVPVDAKLKTELDVEDEALSLDRVLRTIESAKRLRLIILDACRDNPFVAKMRMISGKRGIARGLARVEIETSDTYVAFAAKAGSTAADGDGTDSPFTKALLMYLTTPGLDVRLALGKVRDRVLKETNRQQEPYVYGSLGGDIISLVNAPGQSVSPPTSIAPEARPASKAQPLEIGSLRSLHGDWQVRCNQMGTPPIDQCALIQSVTAKDRENVGLTVIVLKQTDKKGYLLRVVVPLGVLMPSGLGLKIDQADIGRAGFVRCLPNGCIAEVTVGEKLMDQLKSGKVANFIIFQSPTDGIGFPISLAHFGDGVAALQ